MPNQPTAPHSYQRYLSGELDRELPWEDVERSTFIGAPDDVTGAIVAEVEAPGFSCRRPK